MRIEASGVVVESQWCTDRQSVAFPYVCVLPTGRWLCSVRVAPTKGCTTGQRVLLTWSDDQGAHWTEPFNPYPPSLEVEGRRGLIRGAGLTPLGGNRVLATLCWVDNTDPVAPYFNEETEGLLDSRIFLSVSGDGGETWGVPWLADTTPFNIPTPITGPILRFPDGELLLQFELNKHYYDTTEWRHASVMMFSTDEGRTWPRHSVVTQDPANRIFYWDQRPCILPDGRILDVFWTFDRATAKYLNIHARESRDRGRTWSDLWDLGLPDQPGPVFPLSDGSLAIPYVDRTSAPVIRVRRSTDNGRTWSAEGEVIVHDARGNSQTWNKSTMQDAWAEMGKFSVGLPHTWPIEGGGAVIVYYAGQETDVTSVHWALIR